MSTIRQILLFVLSLALLLLLVKCKHEPEKQPDRPCLYDSSIEEMKKWYYFKEGTQWVYQEQATGELDTATVYESFEGDSWFDYYVIHSNGDWTVNYYFDTSWTTNCIVSAQCHCHKVFRSRYKPGNFVGESIPFKFPGILGDYFYDSQSTNTLISAYDSIFIGSLMFSNVVEWNVEIDDSENQSQVVYSLARQFGIIKMQKPESNTTWEIIACEINQ
jgi:hypothetical protein